MDRPTREPSAGSPTILVVDDDPYILNFVKHGLTREGYRVFHASDGGAALAAAQAHSPDLIILDVMLPDIDGTKVCTQLRRSSSAPVIMLSAKTAIPDRVAGLQSGADDYLSKPFAFEELMARVEALLRRLSPDRRRVIAMGDLVLDTNRRSVALSGLPLELTTREYDVLEVLMRHPRAVVKEETLLEQVWGYEYDGQSNVVEVYITYLRRKLAKMGAETMIRTIRGIGYMIAD